MSEIYLTDREIAKRLGMTLVEWTATATVLERSGLPRRSPLFQDRRHWVAVQDYLYTRERRPNKSTPGDEDNEQGFKNTGASQKNKQVGRSAFLLGEQQKSPRPQLRAVHNSGFCGD